MGRRVASFVFARCACRSIAGLMRAMWRAPLRARRRRRLSTSALLASSTPLFRDVLPVESLGENRWARKVAALGVALAFEVLLEEPSAPGWLPALLDEQRVPLSGPMPPIPPRSFSFTEGHGAVPIGVVRSTPQRPMPLAHPRGHTSTSQPAASSSNPPDAESATRRCTNTSCSSSRVCA